MQNNSATNQTAINLFFVDEHQLFVQWTGTDDKDTEHVVRDVYSRIGALVQGDGWNLFHDRMFGVESGMSAATITRSDALADCSPTAPFCYIEGIPCGRSEIAGGIIHLVRAPVDEIVFNGKVVGTKLRCQGKTHVLLSNISGTTGTQIIEAARTCLEPSGLSFGDVARTWFYLDNILDWYDDFNLQRTALYKDLGLIKEGTRTRLPSSTGIKGRTISGNCSLANIHACDSISEFLSNTGQKDAFEYGASFNRGAKIDMWDASLIHLSGTASIDEQGRTIHIGDFKNQVKCTFEKIDQLLAPYSLSVNDMAAGCAFIKNKEDVQSYFDYLASNGLEAIPLVPIIADVCREDLLFEVDGQLLIKM